MTRNSTTYEMALAYVNVAANATSVTVTDKRSDSTVCGWVTVAQSTSGEVDAQLNAMKTGFDGVTYSSPAAMVQGEDELLNSQILKIGDDIYTDETATVSATADDYKLWENGLCGVDTNYKMVKYQVTAGEYYEIISDHMFQFQTVASVPSSGASNRVGRTYQTGTYNLIVPDTATYLIVSTTKNDSSASVKKHNKNAKNDINILEETVAQTDYKVTYGELRT